MTRSHRWERVRERVREWGRAWLRVSLGRPGRVLLAFALVSLGAAVLAGRLELHSSFVELLPDEAREVRDLARVEGKAGGDGYLVVRIRGLEPAPARAFGDALAHGLEALPEVRYVEHHFDASFFEEHGLWLMPLERLRALRQDVLERLREAKHRAVAVDLLDEEGGGQGEPEAAPPNVEDLVRKYRLASPLPESLVSRDGTERYLLVKPAGTSADLAFARRLVDAVRGVADALARGSPGVQIDYGGAFQQRLEEEERMRADLARAGLLSAVLAVLLVLGATRRVGALVVVGGPVLVGVNLTLAFARLAVGHLTLVTGFLAAILLGLGLEYGIHLSLRYGEERRTHPVPEALAAAVGGTFPGALTSGLINAAAFLVLMFARFKAFQQFGLIAGVGVLLALLSAYGLGPALIVLAERWRPGTWGSPAASTGAPAARAGPGRRWPTAGLVGLLTTGLLLAAGSVAVLPRVGFETDLRALQGDTPASLLDEHIRQETGVVLDPAILLVRDLSEAREVSAVIQEVRRRWGAASALAGSASLEDLLPQDVPAHAEEIARLREALERLPRSVRESPRLRDAWRLLALPPHGPGQLPPEVRRRFEALDGEGRFLLLLPATSHHDTRALAAWAEQVGEVIDGARARGVEVSVLDGGLIAARLFSLVRADGPFILGAVAAVVFLALLVSLRGLRRACLVAGPLLLGLLCLAGGMYLFGVRLNFINAVVIPNLFAIAVDNSVHLFHRYEEEGPGSLGHVLRHTGLAAGIATLSNAAGYGALLVSHHPGLKSIAHIALLGVMTTFLGTTVFFPVLLAVRERRGGRTGGDGVVEAGRVQSLEIGAPAEEATVEPGERTSA